MEGDRRQLRRERNCKRKSDFPLWVVGDACHRATIYEFPETGIGILGVQLYPAYPPTTILYPSPRTKTFQKRGSLEMIPHIPDSVGGFLFSKTRL